VQVKKSEVCAAAGVGVVADEHVTGEGWKVGKRRVYRLYWQENLLVRTKMRLIGIGLPISAVFFDARNYAVSLVDRATLAAVVEDCRFIGRKFWRVSWAARAAKKFFHLAVDNRRIPKIITIKLVVYIIFKIENYFNNLAI